MMVGILLAAGASTRMGSHKALRRSGRESFLVRGVRALWTSCDAVVVVLGSRGPIVRRHAEVEFERLVANGGLQQDLVRAKRSGSKGLEAQFVQNRDWQSGMLSSVRVGLKAARDLSPEGLLVLPVDHPDVKPATVASLAELLRAALAASRTRRERASFAYALVPRHKHRRGHPLAISPALASSILADREAIDLSDSVRRCARLVGYVDVNDPGVTRNHNTPRD
jgi:CTP:molybdopterin cytidylyltransferase MocA